MVLSLAQSSTLDAAPSSALEVLNEEQEITKPAAVNELMDVDTVQGVSEKPVSDSSRSSIKPGTRQRATSLPLNLRTVNKSRYGYVYDDRMMLHAPIEHHPESPQRIHGIYQRLREAGCLSKMKIVPIRRAKKAEVLLVHSEDHWEKVQTITRQF